MLIDTHCHIHESDYPLDAEEVIARANKVGVKQIICVGVNESSSRLAIDFANSHDNIFAVAGIHPHNATNNFDQIADILYDTKNANSKLVAIGEIGLDYHYNFSPHDKQIEILQKQIELALKYDLPIVFHVREAFDDFWPVFDNFKFGNNQIKGVIHSFTDNKINISKALRRDLYIGLNGFITFTKDESQKEMFASLPLDKILFETDAPFLTPVPLRGKINEPAFVKNVAEYYSKVCHVDFNKIADMTTSNARTLFNL